MHLLDEGLKRITRENKSRIFVYEEEEETIPAEALEEGSQGKACSLWKYESDDKIHNIG